MTVNHPLAKYRKDHGDMSREALGQKIGVSDVTVGRWEGGKRKIDVALLPKVSQITGIAKSELRPDLADVMNEAAE